MFLPTTGWKIIPYVRATNAQTVGQEPDQHRQLQMFAEVVANNLNQVGCHLRNHGDAAKNENPTSIGFYRSLISNV